MNKITGTIIIMAVCSLSLCISVQARQAEPAPKPSVEIEEYRVVGEAKQGDTFDLLVRYKTGVNSAGTVTFRVPEHVNLSGANDAQNLTVERSFSQNEVYTERFTVQAKEEGYGLFLVQIAVDDAPVGYGKRAERWIKIRSGDQDFEIIDPAVQEYPKEVVWDSKPHIAESVENSKAKSQLTNYSLSVNGKIRFDDSGLKGLYGTKVKLFFRRSINPDPGHWYHPLSGSVQGTHYDLLDEEGNFSFDFNFTDNLSLYGIDQVMVIVTNENSAVATTLPIDGYTAEGYPYFHESDGIIASISPSQSTINVTQNNNSFPPEHGRIMRYAEISREYVLELHSGSPPFVLPKVATFIDPIFDCAEFSYNHLHELKVNLDPAPACSDFVNVAHEYGHYTNYRMWMNYSRYSGADTDLKEGWAIFQSFASRNYGNRQYGDNLQDANDNPEKHPFVVDNNIRYIGIGYADPSSPNYNKEAAAFSGYLWSLYDNPQDPVFLSTDYNLGDNDDIRDRSLRVFSRMSSLGSGSFGTNTPDFHSHFKYNLPSEEQVSINKVYNFMFDTFTSIPSERMRSAQVQNFTASFIDPNSIKFDWEEGSYDIGTYANEETEYYLYKKNGSSWDVIASFPNHITNYTYTPSSYQETYKVTAYNDNADGATDGFSVNAPEIETDKTIKSGDINSSENWSGLIHLTGTTNFYAPVTIQPGTTVLLDPDVSLVVRPSTGKIIAEGTEENPIRFIRADPNEDWNRISLSSSAGNSIKWALFDGGYINLSIASKNNVIEHSTFRNATFRTMEGWHNQDGSGNAGAVLSHVHIENSPTVGLVAQYIDLDMSYSTIENNTQAGIYVNSATIYPFHHNKVTGNGSSSRDGVEVMSSGTFYMHDESLSAGYNEISDNADDQISGSGDMGIGFYYPGDGGYNSIHGNYSGSKYLIDNNSGSMVYAERVWWGEYPISPGMFDGYVQADALMLNYDPTDGVPHGSGGEVPFKIQSSEEKEINFTQIYEEVEEQLSEVETNQQIRYHLHMLYQISGFAKKTKPELHTRFRQLVKNAAVGAKSLYSSSSQNKSLRNIAKVLYAKSFIRDGEYGEAGAWLSKTEAEELEGYDRRDWLHLNMVTETYRGEYETAWQTLQYYYTFQESQGEDMDEVRAHNSVIEEDLKTLIEAGEGKSDEREKQSDVAATNEELTLGNYPNPFNPTTNIRFTLPEQGQVSLVVYDMIGREVATLVNDVLPAGDQTIRFDASSLANGIYLYKLRAGTQEIARTMTLIK